MFRERERCWSIAVAITSSIASEFIPTTTLWFILFSDGFPFGRLAFMPAKQGGIVCTFPHQEANSEGTLSCPWREGKICLDMPIQSLGIVGGAIEPLGDPERRIVWHAERAVRWVEAAARNDLTRVGEPFELPRYPIGRALLSIIHAETSESYAAWTKVRFQSGIVRLRRLRRANAALVATEFQTFEGDEIYASSLPNAPDSSPANEIGVWWKWPVPVVVPPWQAPASWDELRQVGERVGVDVDTTLRDIAARVRGRGRPVLLIGYDMPLRVGSAPTERHWAAIQLPRLKKAFKNSRNANDALWDRDRERVFGSEKKIEYLRTENWSADRMQARGRFKRTLCESNVALIGGGALGSVVAELLVRGGVQQLTLIDGDTFTAGNLARHTLTSADFDKKKALALADRLRLVSLHTTVTGVAQQFPEAKDAAEKLLSDATIVIDCTASDCVLVNLARCWWPVPRLFVSLSVGFEARRLFGFAAFGNTFPIDEFERRVVPWVEQERARLRDSGETLEGAGCWFPLFPARCDDISLAAGLATTLVDRLVANCPPEPRLFVYEQTHDELGLLAYGRVLETPGS